MGWKYVMFKSNMYLVPIIFPDKLVHADIAKAMVRPIRSLTKDRQFKVDSAGMIYAIRTETVGGESTTLGIKSKPHDKKVIEMYPWMHGLNGDD